MALKDYPHLKPVFEALMAKKRAIQAKVAPLRDEYNQVVAEIEPLIAKRRELADQIHAIERPELVEIEQELSAIARATGGKFLNS